MPKKTANVLKYSNQLQDSMEKIVGGASHEINNLLQLISLNSELLESDLSEVEKKRAGQKIDAQIRHITEIIKDLRHVIFNKAETVGEVNVSSVMGSLITLSKGRFNNHNVIMKNNVPDDILIPQCKESEITRAILNVLNTCHDSVLENPASNRWISLDTVLAGDSLKILITDSGPQLEVGEVEDLFTPDFESKGRKGVPLLLAKEELALNGGKLEYSQGDTNTFVISFPNYRNGQAGETAVSPVVLSVVG